MVPEQPTAADLGKQVFNIDSEAEFTRLALQVFRYQAMQNSVYNAFCKALDCEIDKIDCLKKIPFLPIQFFKTRSVVAGDFEPEIVFRSSGTTVGTTSQHFVKDVALYRKSFTAGFNQFYGPADKYCILGLLPSYLEQGSSSLVYMVDELIRQSGRRESGFYLYDLDRLSQTIHQLESKGQPAILFGVSYALLDFAERFAQPLQSTTIIETGGMKGRRKEILKSQLYQELQTAFSTEQIHSEYGMTELLSQAYAINGLYQSPPRMKVLLREETDPFNLSVPAGAINVIDLANIHSCSFIATDDRGRLLPDGRFEVLGRLDNSDVRGCSQLFTESS